MLIIAADVIFKITQVGIMKKYTRAQLYNRKNARMKQYRYNFLDSVFQYYHLDHSVF